MIYDLYNGLYNAKEPFGQKCRRRAMLDLNVDWRENFWAGRCAWTTVDVASASALAVRCFELVAFLGG
jgi:hypothetical protein